MTLRNEKILYIGGFELPDKNAAAQRVVGIAKSLRELKYEVVFVNALKKYEGILTSKEYYGFQCIEYKRENKLDYLIGARTIISYIGTIAPKIVIAYNYPAFALNRIRRYCKKNGIKCIADVTEWYVATGRNLAYRFIKGIDVTFRMKYVHKHVDSVIAISRFLYDYYKEYVPTVLIPPTVDILDTKWNIEVKRKSEVKSFVYAGSPSMLKERLDLIVRAIEACAKIERLVFNVVGITKDEFIKMYSWKNGLPKEVIFWGRLSHVDAIRIVKEANWSIIIRENNTVVKAGFPTKLVESISCGTPVIVNEFSNVKDYLTYDNSIVVENTRDLLKYIEEACEKISIVDRNLFDYHKYSNLLAGLLE